MPRNRMCALALTCAFSAQADVLQWRDSQGHAYFGDRPPPGVTAKLVTLDDSARLNPIGSDDTLARTLRYAAQRDQERRGEMAPVRKKAKKKPASGTKSKKLKWRPGMAW
jgi:hypothetical protein